MLTDEGKRLLDLAVAEWAAGRFYEAHEILEDVAETFEEDDENFDIALALTRAAACLHKLSADVGRSAVPGKLRAALTILKDAPPDWGGLDLAGLVTELSKFEDPAQGPPYPVPRQA